MAACRVTLEAGTQSPWVARLLGSVGHEVLIANPRKLRAIYESDSKSDRLDAQMLARLARIDPRLLAPIHPRSSVCQHHLSLIRSRARLIECRTKLVNHIRGVCKSHGYRLKKCTAKSLHRQARDQIPEELDPALAPILEALATLEASIQNLDCEIKQVFEQEHAAAVNLLTIPGVGVLTALAFVLTLENGERFRKSRDVGSYLGLRPRRDQSGQSDRQLPITKAGDVYLRTLLVNCAHYIMGPFGPDTALRRWGTRLVERGGKNAKKRAIVAVARKLSVLMHHLWVSGEDFEAFPEQQRQPTSAAA
jgi:transposase